MGTESVETYSSLWTTEKDVVILVNSHFGKPSFLLENSIIYFIEKKQVLIIDDDSISKEVTRRMQSAGVRIVPKIPLEIRVVETQKD